MFSALAGTDCGDIRCEVPENSSTLKVSVGLSRPIRSRSSSFAVSSGKPVIEPETSTTKMYSRGGTSDAATRAGRLGHDQEEALVLALVEEQPGRDALAGQAVAQDEVALPPWSSCGSSRTPPLMRHPTPSRSCATGRPARASAPRRRARPVCRSGSSRRRPPGDRGWRRTGPAPGRPSPPGSSSGARPRWETRTRRRALQGSGARCTELHLDPVAGEDVGRPAC